MMTATQFVFWDYVRSMAGITVFFIIFLAATPFILILLILSLGRATNFLMETVAPLMVRPVFFVFGIRLNIKRHAKQITSPAVFIINHSSTLDVLTLLALGLPKVRFVAKWAFQYNPLFFLLGRATGQIFIKRRKSGQAIATLQKTYQRIRANNLSVMMAPEGSRKHSGIIGPFKKGPFRLAVDLNYPIVPIYFEGSRALSEGGSLVAHKGTIQAHVYPPVDTSQWTIEHLDSHIDEVHQQYLRWAGVK